MKVKLRNRKFAAYAIEVWGDGLPCEDLAEEAEI